MPIFISWYLFQNSFFCLFHCFSYCIIIVSHVYCKILYFHLYFLGSFIMSADTPLQLFLNRNYTVLKYKAVILLLILIWHWIWKKFQKYRPICKHIIRLVSFKEYCVLLCYHSPYTMVIFSVVLNAFIELFSHQKDLKEVFSYKIISEFFTVYKDFSCIGSHSLRRLLVIIKQPHTQRNPEKKDPQKYKTRTNPTTTP